MNTNLNWATTVALTVALTSLLAACDEAYRPVFVQVATTSLLIAKDNGKSVSSTKNRKEEDIAS